MDIFTFLNSETGIVEGRAQITSDVPIGKNIHAIGNNKILGIDLDGNVFYMQVKNISEEIAEDNIDDKKTSMKIL